MSKAVSKHITLIYNAYIYIQYMVYIIYIYKHIHTYIYTNI